MGLSQTTRYTSNKINNNRSRKNSSRKNRSRKNRSRKNNKTKSQQARKSKVGGAAFGHPSGKSAGKSGPERQNRRQQRRQNLHPYKADEQPSQSRIISNEEKKRGITDFIKRIFLKSADIGNSDVIHDIDKFDHTETLDKSLMDLANGESLNLFNPTGAGAAEEPERHNVYMFITLHGGHHVSSASQAAGFTRAKAAENTDHVIEKSNFPNFNISKYNLANTKCGDPAYLLPHTAEAATGKLCKGMLCGNPSNKVAQNVVDRILEDYNGPTEMEAAEHAREGPVINGTLETCNIELINKELGWYPDEINVYPYLDEVIICINVDETVKYYRLRDIMTKYGDKFGVQSRYVADSVIYGSEREYRFLYLRNILEFLEFIFNGMKLNLIIIDSSCSMGGDKLSCIPGLVIPQIAGGKKRTKIKNIRRIKNRKKTKRNNNIKNKHNSYNIKN